MKQLNIFDFVAEMKKQDSKRLVYNTNLRTSDYDVLNYLKEHALGEKKAISGKKLAFIFGYDNSSAIRHHIKKLRVDPSIDLKIGSNAKGYFIPFESEYEDSVKLMVRKTFSQLKTMIKLYPRSAKMLHKAVGYQYKTTDKAVQGQMQIQFNGWENEVINHFADKYVEEKK